MGAVSRERLAAVLVEMADTLVDDFDVIDFMQRVSERTAELTEVPAVGISLADQHGELQFVAASDEAARLLDLFQLQAQEGPSLEAFSGQAAILNADLAEAGGRWPLFTAQAADSGFRYVHVIPLRMRSVVIGAMNLFSGAAGTLTDEDAQIVQALADIATIGLLQARAIRRGEVLVQQLQGALDSRVVIEQAKGVLAAVHGVDVDTAFGLLRDHSRSTRRPLGQVALAVVTDPGSVPELSGRSEPSR